MGNANVAANAEIGTLSTTGGTAAFAYELAADTGTPANSADNGSFTIAGDKLKVAGVALATAKGYKVTVKVIDSKGKIYTKGFTITVAAQSADSLTVMSAAVGTSANRTVITINEAAGLGNSLVYKVGNTQITGLSVEDTIADGTVFVSGTTGITVTAGQYVTVYEINASNKIVKYVSRQIAATEIQYFSADPNGVGKCRIRYYSPDGGLDVVIPSVIGGLTVDSINPDVFMNKNLTSVTIPEGIISIGSRAFEGNNLSSVTIPNSVETISSSAFKNSNLTSVNLGTGVKVIGNSAFMDNDLATLVIPNSLTEIEISAFKNNKLTSVTFGTGSLQILENAFQNNLLSSLTIPSNISRINSGAFLQNNLTSITIASGIITFGFTLGDNGNDFNAKYTAGGAGTYTGTQDGEWTKQ